MEHRLGELFSGPGGLALGAHRAGGDVHGQSITHAWASDYDRDTCDTYIKNIPGASRSTVHCQDVRQLDLGRLPAIDGFAFGFPCNDFSVVGEQKGMEGAFGPLYSYGVAVLKSHQPKWFIAENVAGIRNANEGQAFEIIIREMREAGYRLVPHLYQFDHYGVPQARRRVLIVGIREDIEVEFRVPSPEPYASANVSARAALESPPIPATAPNQDRTKQSAAVVERLGYIQPGENAFTASMPDRLRLNVRGAKISQIYKRLDPEKPAYTVTGSGGGGTHIYHWDEPRALTNRERARLQSFPDDFEFLGSRESVRRQIGMAVPVEGARAVVKALLQSFAGEPYPSIPANIQVDSGIGAVN
jgi:DNA (cytosine-5)-methyltransferase 1